MKEIKRALISVSDKSNLEELCRTLEKYKIEIFSTGGTLTHIQKAGFPAKSIEELTDFPSILHGRVKSLHPSIHGGILAKRDDEQDKADMQKHGIQEIDLVVCNLYPFRDTIKKKDVTLDDAIENIDIGGPTMIRSAAKNFQNVAVLCNVDDYKTFTEEMDKNKGSIPWKFRLDMARLAFSHTASYDSYISSYFNGQENLLFPENLTITFRKKEDLRYGENPHQKAAYYINEANPPNYRILQGKQISYNNILDLTGALEAAASLPAPGAVIIKHTNPCGAAIHEDMLTAYEMARACDPISAFGGIAVFHKEVDEKLALKLTESFFEVIAAASFSKAALDVFKEKKNLRIIETDYLNSNWSNGLAIRSVYGGVLVQESDSQKLSYLEDIQVKTKIQPSKEDLQGLLFAWSIVRSVKSNAIVFTTAKQTLGIGAGQMSRVDSVELAMQKAKNAGLDLKGSFLASDAFFPFRDAIESAHKAGVKGIIQPGGSIRDGEVIEACDELGLSMVFTGFRHFRH